MASDYDALTGTSLRVYRLIYKKGPVRLSDLQRELKMSSPSVVEYHLQKLLRLGLIHERSDGFVSDRIVFENMIRIRRMIIPLWATFSAFLATSLVLLLTLLRPSMPSTPSYLFSLGTVAVSLVVSLYQVLVTLRQRV